MVFQWDGCEYAAHTCEESDKRGLITKDKVIVRSDTGLELSFQTPAAHMHLKVYTHTHKQKRNAVKEFFEDWW